MAARLDVAVELFYDGGWHDLVRNDDVFAAPIVIKRGQSDEATQLRPASVGLQLANDDDMYRTSNPESPLYGKAGLNTPTRVSVGGKVRGAVEASSWTAGQSRDFRARPKRGKAWVDVEGGGLLERVGGWTETLKSPFRQYNESLPLSIGYWPGEQARGSTSLESVTPGTQQIFFQGIAPDSQYRPPSSAPLMDMGQSDDAEVGARFARAGASPTAGWQLSWVSRLEPLTPGPDTIINVWSATDGTAYGLYLNTTTGQMNLASSKGGVPVLNSFASYNGYDWSQWTLFSVDAQYSAGTTTVWVNWTNADNTISGFMNGSFSGAPEQLDDWDMSVFAGTPPGSTFGHVLAVREASTGGTVNLFNSARRQAWAGYLGEKTADRLARLCALKNVAYSIVGTATDSYPMGPQPVASFPELLAEIVRTEDGLLFDAIDAIELVFVLRNARENQTPALTLTPTDMPTLPDEVNDNLGAHNIITASQRDGGDYTVSDDTGPLGTQPPPDGAGDARQTVDVNVANEAIDLPLIAGYWLNKGTVNLPRYPQITVNLAALDAAKIAEVEAVDVGSVITITRLREYTIRLWVLGYTETIRWPIGRTIVFTCAPDQPYVVAVLGTSRLNSGTTTLKTAVNAGATALTFRTTDIGDVWNTVTPYDAMIAGQRQTVTSMGAAALVSGAYDQAATVIRGVDGIRKPLAAGAPITVPDPFRLAL